MELESSQRKVKGTGVIKYNERERTTGGEGTIQTKTDAKGRKRGKRNGLDTQIVRALNDECKRETFLALGREAYQEKRITPKHSTRGLRSQD